MADVNNIDYFTVPEYEVSPASSMPRLAFDYFTEPVYDTTVGNFVVTNIDFQGGAASGGGSSGFNSGLN